MDKLLIDVNIILDVVLDREVDGSSAAVMNLIDEGKARGLSSAASYTAIYYLINKFLDHHKALRVIQDLLAILQIIPIDEKTLNSALNEKGPDFEDNIQIVSARLSKADYIITRNLSHFKYSPIQALSPGEYLKKSAL